MEFASSPGTTVVSTTTTLHLPFSADLLLPFQSKSPFLKADTGSKYTVTSPTACCNVPTSKTSTFSAVTSEVNQLNFTRSTGCLCPFFNFYSEPLVHELRTKTAWCSQVVDIEAILMQIIGSYHFTARRSTICIN